MIPVVIKNCKIGEGSPKIIVPIVASTKEGILAEANNLKTISFDVLEWRIDWYEDVSDVSKINETATQIKDVLKDIPLLITFRTAKEGGQKDIDSLTYKNLMCDICNLKAADLIDVELFTGDDIVTEIISVASKNQIPVIASNHEWHSTPSTEEIINRLQKMRSLGADIAKIAVTPTSKADVLSLLSATEEASRLLDCPIVTMSMGSTGVVSRLVGESFGSAMTFGAAAKASAPGQINVNQLRTVLDIIHASL